MRELEKTILEETETPDEENPTPEETPEETPKEKETEE